MECRYLAANVENTETVRQVVVIMVHVVELTQLLEDELRRPDGDSSMWFVSSGQRSSVDDDFTPSTAKHTHKHTVTEY